MSSTWIGSPNIEVSVAGKNIIPERPDDWSFDYNLKEFTFINYQDCHVLINGSRTPIFIKQEQGIDYSGSQGISSFTVVESGIEYNYIGAC